MHWGVGGQERSGAIAREKKEMSGEAAYWVGMSLLKLGEHARAEQVFADAVASRKSEIAPRHASTSRSQRSPRGDRGPLMA